MSETAHNSNWPVCDDEVSVGDKIVTELEVQKVPEGEEIPCDYCSTREHAGPICERGVIPADYKLVNTYGVTFGYSCHACIAEAETDD